MTLAELKAAMVAKLAQARDVAAAAEKDGNRDFTAEERQQVASLMAEAKGFKDQIQEREGDAALRASIKDLGEGLELNDDPKGSGPLQPGAKARTLSDRFLESDAYKAWWKSVAPAGRIPEGAKGLHSPTVDVGKILRTRPSKAAPLTGGSATSAGALVFPQDLGLRSFGTFQRPLAIRDVITEATTDTDSVEYARITGFTNAAAPVEEATALTGTSGTKPQSVLTLERVSAGVKTIAHWMAATKRALSDAGQLRVLIDTFLDYGLEEELEDQIVNGDGTGENLEGFSNVSGIQTQSWSSTLLDTLRKAKTKVRTGGRAIPTAYLLHPNDAERVDLEKINSETNHYVGPGPFADSDIMRVWRLPVVETEAVTEGVGYCADFRTIVLFDREQASITVSDSHEDFFVRNLVAILAEMRAALAVYNAKAIVEIDLTA